jgi:hypothetical protein
MEVAEVVEGDDLATVALEEVVVVEGDDWVIMVFEVVRKFDLLAMLILMVLGVVVEEELVDAVGSD